MFKSVAAVLLISLLLQQEAFEKCWAHSPLRAVLHCHSPGVATVACRHCRTPPVHRCPRRRRRQQRQRVTKATAMAPWNGPNKLQQVFGRYFCAPSPFCYSTDSGKVPDKMAITDIKKIRFNAAYSLCRPSSRRAPSCGGDLAVNYCKLRRRKESRLASRWLGTRQATYVLSVDDGRQTMINIRLRGGGGGNDDDIRRTSSSDKAIRTPRRRRGRRRRRWMLRS